MPTGYNSSRDQFEHRMRLRRAATCLALARSAIAAGRIVEATERLEEACTLDPDAADARLLLEELQLQEPSERLDDTARPAPVGELAAWSHWLAAGIAICALAALAVFWPTNRPQTGNEGDRRSPQLETPSATPSGAPATADAEPVPEGLAAQLEMTTGTAGAGSPNTSQAPSSVTAAPVPDAQRPGLAAPPPQKTDVVTSRLPMVSAQPPAQDATGSGRPEQAQAPTSLSSAGAGANAGPQPGATRPAADATAANAVGVPPSDPALAVTSQARPTLPPLERVAVLAEDPKVVPSEAVTTPAPLAAPPAARADVPEEASMRVEASEAEIQQTLHQYADAYARLDAGAARRVWPTVDQRALARAFEGLESQGLVFDHCDLRVAGEEATATCNGRARYVPKVGSREPLVEQREWTFRLHKGDAGWQIMQAQAR